MENRTHLSKAGKLVYNVPEGRTKFTALCRKLMLDGSADNEGKAILLAAQLDGDAYNEWEKAGRPRD